MVETLGKRGDINMATAWPPPPARPRLNTATIKIFLSPSTLLSLCRGWGSFPPPPRCLSRVYRFFLISRLGDDRVLIKFLPPPFVPQPCVIERFDVMLGCRCSGWTARRCSCLVWSLREKGLIPQNRFCNALFFSTTDSGAEFFPVLSLFTARR